MELSEEALKEFEALWQEDHPGQKIERAKLVEMASRVLRAIEITYIAIPKDKAEIFEQIKKQHYK